MREKKETERKMYVQNLKHLVKRRERERERERERVRERERIWVHNLKISGKNALDQNQYQLR